MGLFKNLILFLIYKIKKITNTQKNLNNETRKTI